ncbi:hypothetical protein N0V83_008174 [Neocucurbitaria cava]|uniref:Uncharacterized protein n=1 Tax=Neocucurbitaria cava TaxID=798079 RepID=A0A9W9CIH8_9PLEO|nr:hypothetical protein N0V83_008174 [Neocucurbitaria cava]
MDEAWNAAVNIEQELRLPSLSTGLSMEAKVDGLYQVKPFGSLDAPLLVLSSYPTKDPSITAHLEYGIVNDMSNLCIFSMYAKLGFHKANDRSSSMLHLDFFPRRIDRKVIPGGIPAGSGVLRKMPSALRDHWQEFASDCILRSKAHVAIVFGQSAARVYEAHLYDQGIDHKCVWQHDFRRHKDEIPYAWLEFSSDSSSVPHQLTRIAFGVYHPESFMRGKGMWITDVQRNLAFRERLIDLACVYLYGEPHMPVFLSSHRWHRRVSQ